MIAHFERCDFVDASGGLHSLPRVVPLAPRVRIQLQQPLDIRALRGPLCLGGAATIWGSTFVVSAAVLRVMPAMVLVELRYLIAFPILACAASARGNWRVRGTDVFLFATLGLLGFTVSIGLQFAGTALAGAALGSLITAASPALIALFAAWLFHERLTWRSGSSIVLGLAGIAAVVGLPGSASGAALWGDGALCLAALTWAAYTVGGRVATLRYSPVVVTAWATAFGAVFSLPPAVVQVLAEGWALPTDPWIWLGVVYIGVVCTAAAFYLWNKGFVYVPAGSGSLYLLIQPVVGSVLGAILLGERLGLSFAVGAAFIFLAVIVAARSGPVASHTGARTSA